MRLPKPHTAHEERVWLWLAALIGVGALAFLVFAGAVIIVVTERSEPDSSQSPSVVQSAELFLASGCGDCHRLGLAQTTGTSGPDLDRRLNGSAHDVAYVASRIREGGGGMPAFGETLSERQIRGLAEYVLGAARSE